MPSADLSKHVEFQDNIDHVKFALDNISVTHTDDEKLILKLHNGLVISKPKEIIDIEARDNYSLLKFTNDKNIIVAKTLRYFEERLEGKGFFRSHKSHLVHKIHIKGVQCGV